MCGIIGYIGNGNAGLVVSTGLKKLEYRGYDSWGLAYQNEGIKEMKNIGKIGDYNLKLPETRICIGHTRWATHGGVTKENAHPHLSCDGKIALIHNGIVENYLEIKRELGNHDFKSETDTEVVVHLIEENMHLGFREAVSTSLKKLKGSFSFVIMHDNQIIAARRDSPLVIGVDGNNFYAASDFPAFVDKTQDVIFLENNELAVLGNRLEFYNYETGEKLEKNIEKIDWTGENIEKGNYKHFMMKEIMEQPDTLKKTLQSQINLDFLGDYNRIVIIGCGTSWHAGLVGEYFLEKLTGIPVEVEYASEFRYRNPIIDNKTLCIAISQSGETADTLAAVREAQKRGAKVIGIINVKGSSMSRICDHVFYTEAGPEIGVASTKAFTTQLAVLLMISIQMSGNKDLLDEVKKLPVKMEQILESNKYIKECAEKYYDKNNALFLGRGPNYPIALEGALKLKEISYIHAEGYPAAEMKHGPIALIDENMPVVFLALKDSSYEKIMGNIQEVKSRNGKVIVISNEKEEISKIADTVIKIPETHELLVPFLSVIPLQLLAYHIADKRGCDIDKPRNLAKSVTVE